MVIVILASPFIVHNLFRFDSPGKIIKILQERYHEKFTINGQIETNKYFKIYNISPVDDREMELIVKTSWRDSHFSDIFPFIWIPGARQPLYDNYYCMAWVKKVTPILNKYGVTNTYPAVSDCQPRRDIATDSSAFKTERSSSDFRDDKFFYNITDDNNIQREASIIYQLINEIRQVRPFVGMEQSENGYSISLAGSDGLVLMIKHQKDILRARINYPHTEESILQAITNKFKLD